MRKKTTPSLPSEPTNWDLSAIAPWAFDGGISQEGFAQAWDSPKSQQPAQMLNLLQQPHAAPTLKEPQALLEALEAKKADYFAYIEENEKAICAQQEAPDAKQISALLIAHGDICKEAYYLGQFFDLYQQAHYSDPDAQALITTGLEAAKQITQRAVSAWDNLALSDETIDALNEEVSWLKLHRNHLAPNETQEYLSGAQKYENAAQENPLLVDFHYLYDKINSDASIEPKERSHLVTQMYNAKIHQEIKKAESQGLSVLQQAAHKNGLPEEMPEIFLDNAQRFAHNSMKTPQPPEPEFEVSWQEAMDVVITAFTQFHPEMGELAQVALQEGWVDAEKTEHKFHNAATFPSSQRDHAAYHPYVLMNFEPNADGVHTLAHELGHAIARFLENDKHRIPGGSYIDAGSEPATDIDHAGKIVIVTQQPSKQPQGFSHAGGAYAETFAELAEALAMDELITRQTDLANREALVNFVRWDNADSIFDDLYQIENSLYKQVAETGEPLTQEDIVEAYRTETHRPHADADEVMAYLGNSLHLIKMEPYYRMDYSFAEVGAQNILAKLQDMPPEEAADYKQKWMDIMHDAPEYSYGSAMRDMGVPLDDVDALLNNALKREFPAAGQDIETTPKSANFRERITQRRTQSANTSQER